MELKSTLSKPYSDDERKTFIVEQNHHLGYEIRETEMALEAWGYTQEEKQEQERQAINMLSLTKREVFLAIYRDKQITPEQIRAMITNPESLIEFDYAEKFYRGNPLIDSMGLALGYTTEQLDYLFISKELPTVEE